MKFKAGDTICSRNPGDGDYGDDIFIVLSVIQHKTLDVSGYDYTDYKVMSLIENTYYHIGRVLIFSSVFLDRHYQLL